MLVVFQPRSHNKPEAPVGPTILAPHSQAGALSSTNAMYPLAWSSAWNSLTARKALHLSSLPPVVCCSQSAHPGCRPLLTITQDSDVLIMKTVVNTPASAATLAQCSFLPLALHVVQQDGALTLAKGKGPRHGQCQATAQLTTHHVGIHHVPIIIADTAPRATMQDLQAPPAAAWAPHQPHLCGER